jgi:NAD(P)-dependent dehydrogenase (short-subunit alcohol dehydrogenase family)
MLTPSLEGADQANAAQAQVGAGGASAFVEHASRWAELGSPEEIAELAVYLASDATHSSSPARPS